MWSFARQSTSTDTWEARLETSLGNISRDWYWQKSDDKLCWVQISVYEVGCENARRRSASSLYVFR